MHEQFTRRRSKRLRMSIPVVLLAKTPSGDRIETSGETIDVSNEGARLRTLEPVPPGSQVRIAIVRPYRWRRARVIHIYTQDPFECGVELEKPEKFWGLYCPADDWDQHEVPHHMPHGIAVVEPKIEADRREVPGAAAAAAPVETPISYEPELPAGVPEVMTAGTEVLINGMSVVRMPFQEKTVVLGADEAGVVFDLSRVIEPGSRCRVRVKHHEFIGKVMKITARPVHGRWGIWVKF